MTLQKKLNETEPGSIKPDAILTHSSTKTPEPAPAIDVPTNKIKPEVASTVSSKKAEVADARDQAKLAKREPYRVSPSVVQLQQPWKRRHRWFKRKRRLWSKRRMKSARLKNHVRPQCRIDWNGFRHRKRRPVTKSKSLCATHTAWR